MMSLPRSRQATVLAAASLLLLAVNLRPLFTSAGALLPELSQVLGLTGAQSGYLNTLPIFCMGLFAPLAPRIAGRVGIERTLLLVLLLIAAGDALRGASGIGALFLGTAVAGGGVALGNVLLPTVVKRDFSRHAALMTGLYTMCIVGGAAIPAAATVPLMRHFGADWSFGLAMWAVPALVAGLIWLPLALRARPGATPLTAILPVKGLVRDPLAWAVTLFMGLQSALGYSVFGWMVPILQERGLSSTQAGIMTSVSILIQVAACLLTAPLTTRGRDQRLLALILTAVGTLPLVGIILAPISWLWPLAIIQGIGQGGLFALALMLIVLRTDNQHATAHLSSMAQTTGYLLASCVPFLIGLLHEHTGGFHSTAWLMLGLALCISGAGWVAGRNRVVRVSVQTP